MPPKARPCSARSQTLVPSARTDMIKALKTANYLGLDIERLKDANECIFSYPNSNWFSLYIKGNENWDYNGNSINKLYFQLSDDKEPKLIDITTTVPPELEGKETCIFANGKCSDPTPKVPKVPKTASKAAKGKEIKVIEDEPSDTKKASASVLSIIEPMNIKTNVTKTQKPREFFEGMDDKKTIVAWMLKNMELNDIHACIKRGNLSKEDIKNLNAIREEPGDVGVSVTPRSNLQERDMEILVDSILTNTKENINDILKQVSTRGLRDALPANKKIREFTLNTYCTDNGIPIKGVTTEKKLKYCVNAESIRLINKLKSAMAILIQKKQSDKKLDDVSKLEEAISKLSIPESSGSGAGPSKISKVSLLQGNPKELVPAEYIDLVAEYFPIIKGLKVDGNKINGAFPVPGKKTYYKAIDIKFSNLISLNKEIGEGKILSFGKKMNPYRLKFKMAAKDCKGSGNYRACMKKMLSK